MSKTNLRTEAIKTQDEVYFTEGPSMDDIRAKRRGVLPKQASLHRDEGGGVNQIRHPFYTLSFPFESIFYGNIQIV